MMVNGIKYLIIKTSLNHRFNELFREYYEREIYRTSANVCYYVYMFLCMQRLKFYYIRLNNTNLKIIYRPIFALK